MDIRIILVSAFAILFAITVHEAAHAWMASKLGDQTAAALGRISLNPLAHIDPIGTVLFPAMLIIISQGRGPVFGWAKPVPYNPYNLRHPKRGRLWISFAGPVANVLTAAAAVLVFQALKAAGLPLPNPFYRSVLAPNLAFEGLAMVLGTLAIVNISLAVFNLIPIPPLDGSGILAGLLSGRAAEAYGALERYGFILLLLLMVSRLPDYLFIPVHSLIRALFS